MKKYFITLSLASLLNIPLPFSEFGFSQSIVQAQKVSETSSLYEAVNYNWLKESEIPNDKPGITNFSTIQDTVYEKIRVILEEKVDEDKLSDEAKKARALYRLFLDTKSRDKVGLKAIEKDLRKIDKLDSHEDVALHFAKSLEMGITSPIVMLSGPDFYNSSKELLWVSQSGLGMPARSMYLDEDARSSNLRKLYVEHLKVILNLAKLPDADKTAEEVMKLETALAQIQWSPEQTRDVKKTYNKKNLKEISSILTNIPVKDILDEFDISDSTEFNLSELSYLEAFNTFFHNQSVDTWKKYLKVRLLTGFSNILTSDFHNADIAYKKALGMIQEDSPAWLNAVRAVEGAMPMILGKVYVERYFDNTQKQAVQKIVKEIQSSAKEVLGNSKRLSVATREKAIKKLEGMSFNIGYPDKWRNFDDLEIDEDSLVQSIKNAAHFDLVFNYSKLDKPVDREEWDRSPHEVNAFYDPNKNKFVLLAGILNPPFFDPKGDLAASYGGLGFVVGHEIGHAFDDNGAQFDEVGNLKDWWTPEDSEQFNKAKVAYIKQANNFQIFPKMFLKGEIEIGEILGDATGSRLALHALDKEILAQKLNRKLVHQSFFRNLANVWREKYRKELQALLIATDPHPPGKFRTDGIVKNMPEFHEAFNTKPENKMYLKKSNQITVW